MSDNPARDALAAKALANMDQQIKVARELVASLEARKRDLRIKLGMVTPAEQRAFDRARDASERACYPPHAR